MTTPIQTAATRLTALVKAGPADPSVARSAIACAAVDLMDCAARPGTADDLAVVYQAAQFAESAALCAYGQGLRDYRRADDEVNLRNALRAFRVREDFEAKGLRSSYCADPTRRRLMKLRVHLGPDNSPR